MSTDDTTPEQPGRQPAPDSAPNGDATAASGQQPSFQPPSDQHGQNQPTNPPFQGQQQNPYQSGQQQAQNPYQQGQQQTPNPYQQGQQQGQGQQQAAYQTPPTPYGQQQPGQPTGAQNPYQQGQQGQQPGGQYATAQNPYATAAPKQPMDPKQKKKIILWSSIAGGAIVLIAAAAITISVLNTTAFGPQAKVEDYLKAIAAGDAKLATSLVAPDPSIVDTGDDATDEASPAPDPDADADADAEEPAAVDPKALLTNEVLKAADERITDPKVGRVSSRNGEASVEVSYELAGKRYEDRVTLKSEGKQFLFFDQWKLDSSLVGSINVYTGLGSTAFSVNGINFDGATDESLFAYPAVYTIAPPESKYLAGDAQTVTLTSYTAGEGSAFIDINVTATEALTTEVTTQVVAMIEKCLEATTLDTTCGVMPSWQQEQFTSVGPVTWTLTSPPVIEVDEGGTYFYTSDGRIDGSFDASWYGSAVSGQQVWDTYLNFPGTISIDADDKVTVTFDEEDAE